MSAYAQLVSEMEKEFPKFQLVEKKSSSLMSVLNIGLKILTLGKMQTFMTLFTTTIGYKVYTPTGWHNLDRIGILKHERIHMRQMRRYGSFWYFFSYLFLWMPIGLAYFRKKYEQEAYEESMRHLAVTHGVGSIEDVNYRNQIINYFTSFEYAWTWPFRESIEKWFDNTVGKIKLEMGLPVKDA